MHMQNVLLAIIMHRSYLRFDLRVRAPLPTFFVRREFEIVPVVRGAETADGAAGGFVAQGADADAAGSWAGAAEGGCEEWAQGGDGGADYGGVEFDLGPEEDLSLGLALLGVCVFEVMWVGWLGMGYLDGVEGWVGAVEVFVEEVDAEAGCEDCYAAD
jgi:hypothetical protein